MLRLRQSPDGRIISLEEAKAHLRANGSDDLYIQSLIDIASAYLDGRNGLLGRALFTQKWTLALDAFPDCGKAITIPLPPLSEIEEFRYKDSSGNDATLDTASDLSIKIDGDQGSMVNPSSGKWPEGTDIEIDFTAGYGNVSDIPVSIQHAAKLLVSQWYENREATGSGTELPFAVDALLAPYKVVMP